MAWRAPVTSALLTCDANYEMFLDTSGNPIILFPKPREVIHFVFTIASEIGEVDTLDWQVLGGNRIINDSALSAVTDAFNVDCAVADNQANDYYMGMYLNMSNGGEAGELRLIGDYATATNLLTFVTALSGTPDAGELYDIYHLSEVVDGFGSITSATTLTEALPQNAEFGASGYPCLIPRVKAGGGTDAHIALLTYSIDGVDA